jgi:hypothetical protein
MPVIVGFAPPDTVRLSDLADASVLRQVLDDLRAASGVDRGRAALTLMHQCLAIIEAVLTGPLELDGISLRVRAHELGARLHDGRVSAAWVLAARPVAVADPAAHLGVTATSLLVPVIAAIHGLHRLPVRGLDNVMLDGLAAGYRRSARLAGREPDAAFVARLLSGAGRPAHPTARPLDVAVDDGPAVTFHVPATCCVLASSADGGSCPTCPQWPDDGTRRGAIRAWVEGMDAAGFRATVGRDRIDRIGRGSEP